MIHQPSVVHILHEFWVIDNDLLSKKKKKKDQHTRTIMAPTPVISMYSKKIFYCLCLPSQQTRVPFPHCTIVDSITSLSNRSDQA